MQLPAPHLSELGPGQTAGLHVGAPPPAAPLPTFPNMDGIAPRVGWPAKGTLDYMKVGIEVLLLVLAIPWLLRQLVKHPGKVSKEAAQHHLKGG